jgi:hypothetical protein
VPVNTIMSPLATVDSFKLLKQKKRVMLHAPSYKMLAGEEGFEPSHAGIKIRCLNQLGDSPFDLYLLLMPKPKELDHPRNQIIQRMLV